MVKTSTSKPIKHYKVMKQELKKAKIRKKNNKLMWIIVVDRKFQKIY